MRKVTIGYITLNDEQHQQFISIADELMLERYTMTEYECETTEVAVTTKLVHNILDAKLVSYEDAEELLTCDEIRVTIF